MSNVAPATQNEVLQCFGKSWSSSSPICAGGPDPTYRDPTTGSHVRLACDFFTSCGAHTKAQEMIPASQLVRQAQPTSQPTNRFTQFVEQKDRERIQQQQNIQHAAAQQAAMTQYRQVYVQQQQSHYLQPQPQYVPPPQPYPYAPPPPPPQHPAPAYQLNYMVPGYLSVPEMRQPDGSFWGLLGREAVRSVGKAFGHTLANFFDSNPFRTPRQ